MVVAVAVGHGRVLVLLALEVRGVAVTVQTPQQPLQELQIGAEVAEVAALIAVLLEAQEVVVL
jgi:hypothetical protein